MKLPHVLLITLLLTVLAPLASAEPSFAVTEGNYIVHYSAFPSVFLDPEIARRYKIERSENRGVVNIAVRKLGSGLLSSPVAATVQGTVSDLIHNTDLAFREIREKDAVYYIAEFWHGQKGIVRFDVEVIPKARDNPIKATFSEDFSNSK